MNRMMHYYWYKYITISINSMHCMFVYLQRVSYKNRATPVADLSSFKGAASGQLLKNQPRSYYLLTFEHNHMYLSIPAWYDSRMHLFSSSVLTQSSIIIHLLLPSLFCDTALHRRTWSIYMYTPIRLAFSPFSGTVHDANSSLSHWIHPFLLIRICLHFYFRWGVICA